MDIHEWIVYFLRKNTEVGKKLSQNECILIGKKFDTYLSQLPEKTRITILPSSLFDILSNSDNPLRENGFHPALVAHFLIFLNDNISQANGSSFGV